MNRLRQILLVLLHVEGSPERTALAFAAGVWIAFSPIIGIHTILALGVAFAFRLSRAATLLGAYLSNPWTVAPIVMASTALGCLLMGVSPSAAWEVEIHGSWSMELFQHLRPLLLPYVVGSLVLGTAAAAVAYVTTRAVLRRRRSGAASEDATGDPTPSAE